VTLIEVPPTRRGGPADVVFVLSLLQVAFLALAAVGEALLMGGNGAYLLVPLMKSVILVWLGTKIVTGRRWAMVTMIVLQSITLAGFAVQLMLSFVPAIGLTVNLVGVTTNLALPVAVIVLCVRSMPVRSMPPMPPLPPAQDPYAPAPILPEDTTVSLSATHRSQPAVPRTLGSSGSLL
jgi:hypothetical protein